MNFVQTEFLWFFGILFTLYWGLQRREWQNALLIVASAIFYGWVHPWFLLLLYLSAVIDYFAGIGMERYPERKKLILAVSLTANTVILGYYKYFDFFVVNVAEVLTFFGVDNSLRPLGIFLPPGISFYTFQSMAYSIDIYRGEMKARRNVLEYMLAVSFFAHLVAGPVQRASNLLMQAETARTFQWAMIRSGFALAMWGAFKKVACADTVAPYVDKIFLVKEPSAAMIWAATLGFTVQILADFSGYTDIARGVARMLGWELMENFKNPYIATNPGDFWRRWHISFSSWIRDYLFISFGGSRGTRLQTHLAIMASMLISGLWHGASWNFVVWGAYHGALQIIYREAMPKIPDPIRHSRAGHVAAVALMFSLTVFGWLLFRETSIARIGLYLSLPLAQSTEAQSVAATVMLAVTAAAATPLVLGLLFQVYVQPKIQDSPWYLPLQTTAWAAFAVAVFIFARGGSSDFIYFQF